MGKGRPPTGGAGVVLEWERRGPKNGECVGADAENGCVDRALGTEAAATAYSLAPDDAVSVDLPAMDVCIRSMMAMVQEQKQNAPRSAIQAPSKF